MAETGERTVGRADEVLAVAAPWFADFGNWIFGALIALDLVILGAILTIGPVDRAVKIATAGTAMALAPGGLGLLLLRLLTDVRSIRRSHTGRHAQGEPERKPEEGRLNMVALRYTVALLLVTFLLTLVGLTAAVWHIASWIAVAFLGALGGSLVIFVLAASRLGAFASRRPHG